MTSRRAQQQARRRKQRAIRRSEARLILFSPSAESPKLSETTSNESDISTDSHSDSSASDGGWESPFSTLSSSTEGSVVFDLKCLVVYAKTHWARWLSEVDVGRKRALQFMGTEPGVFHMDMLINLENLYAQMHQVGIITFS